MCGSKNKTANDKYPFSDRETTRLPFNRWQPREALRNDEIWQRLIYNLINNSNTKHRNKLRIFLYNNFRHSQYATNAETIRSVYHKLVINLIERTIINLLARNGNKANRRSEKLRDYVYENTRQFFTAYELYVQILTCKCMDKNNECHIETLRDKI